ncbi:hypothetical protein LG315_06490 [Microbacterium marinum]|uniref:hypothetical protein n=1 Tax=Microbacterium marinum TaxID=421115 RepID=UPI00384E1C27
MRTTMESTPSGGTEEWTGSSRQWARRAPWAVLAMGLAAGGTLLMPSLSSSAADAAPPPDTVVQVTGDAANGFEILYADGSGLFPPTDSEALAECSEYDTRVERVRCRTEVRTWYRDLAVLQQALDWASAADD